MKKFTLLFSVAAILALSTFGASAYTPDEKDSYTITYNVGVENAGKMYGMVAISGTGDSVSTTNTDDIVYIDQATAEADGSITFRDFAPMGAAPSDPAYQVSTVFIGGPSFDTVQKIGTLDGVKSEGSFAITGKVSDTVNTKAATITVLNGEDEVASVAAAADGTFSIPVAAGTYSVKFTKPGFCSFTYTGVAVAADVALEEVDMTALAGDIADGGNGEVVLNDLTTLLADYNHSGTAIVNALADLDVNGEVMLSDLTALLTGYNGKNVVEAYVAE